MLDFELLRAFVAIVDCGGFHRAAERLNLTQSTVSQQIKRLALETERPLFRRTTRSVALPLALYRNFSAANDIRCTAALRNRRSSVLDASLWL